MKHICIHGHFYQPPRENPWLESIEQQDSAEPYHDWNARVSAECYAPNATARLLDGQDRIVRIINNYARISFNFGPTLLSWLEQKQPEVYAAILQADRESRKRFGGHGSALAQAYNHLIMPLANPRDQETQVIWGLADFEHRFGRPAEGFWLPETAVDNASLALLARHGVRYTILSPYQAHSIRWDSSAWADATGGKIDPARPYLVRPTPDTEIAVFFYDGPVSQAVAFERLLENGDRFLQRLLNSTPDTKGPRLIHIATDGETYGHHHRHGEMALAYALEAAELHGAKLTNYGQFLAAHPPEYEARVIERSAWSCSHGVGRWSEDCGCATGAHPSWHQRWRKPLREAFDWLRDRAAAQFESTPLLRDPWAARNAYIRVVLDRSAATRAAFLAEFAASPLTPENEVAIWKQLELQRHALLMYTSCGWFFDDVGGLEGIQVLQYAGRAAQLLGELTGEPVEAEFLAQLAKVPSNDPESPDAAQIYQAHVEPSVATLEKLCAHYAISSLFTSDPAPARIFCYEHEPEVREQTVSGRVQLAVGVSRFTSEVTRESARLFYAALHYGDQNMSACVAEVRDGHPPEKAALLEAFGRADIPKVVRLLDRLGNTYTLHSLFKDQQRRILRDVLQETIDEWEGVHRRLYRENAPLVKFLGSVHMPLPRVLQVTAGVALNSCLHQALTAADIDPARVEALLDEAKAHGVNLDTTRLEFTFRQRLESAGRDFAQAPKDAAALHRFLTLVTISRRLPFPVSNWSAQNVCYQVLQKHLAKTNQSAQAGDAKAAAWIASFRTLAGALSIYLPEAS
jgi:hypothetical protein